jgi:small subunit ribosomal protein S13
MLVYIFKDVKLNMKRELASSLTYIFGIGKTRSVYLRNLLGISNKEKLKDISEYQYYVIVFLIKNYYMTENDLKQKLIKDFELILDSKCFKFLRYNSCLPLNGQNTRTNAKSSKNRRGIKKRLRIKKKNG